MPGVVSAFGVFMMTQFFQTLPKEMREAAIVDGAGEFRIFARIYLPLARPAVATLALFVFMDSWDQLLWPMIVAPNPDMRTLQVGLAFIRQAAPIENQVMAAIVVTVDSRDSGVSRDPETVHSGHRRGRGQGMTEVE